MFSRITGAAIASLIAMAVGVPMAMGQDQTPADKGNGLSFCDANYLDLYKQADELGHPLGKNLVKEGTDDNDRVCKQMEKLHDVVVALTAPAPEPVAAEPVYEEPVAASSGSSSVGNATVMCESGGDYSINTGNGYYGGYQFDSQTWDAYGDSQYEEAHLAPPAVQDAAAASVPYDAWPNC